jgi:hypothetical protein
MVSTLGWWPDIIKPLCAGPSHEVILDIMKVAAATIMEAVAFMYPPLSSRQQISVFYQVLTFALTLVPFFCRNRRRVAIALFPIILTLCLCAQYYTFSNPSADYYNSSLFIAMPIWFLDLAILTPQKGPDAPAYTGQPNRSESSFQNLKSAKEKLRWVCSLMVPSHRGVAWNW